MPPLSVTVADPAVTVASNPSVILSTVLTPAVKAADATLLTLVPLVRASTMPFNAEKMPPITRMAPPRPPVAWLPMVTAPVAVSDPPATVSAPLELLVPRPMVPTVAVPPLTMKPELKSTAAALLRRMLTSVAENVPPLTRNVLPKSELVRTGPKVAVPESSVKRPATPPPIVTRPVVDIEPPLTCRRAPAVTPTLTVPVPVLSR